MKDIPHGMNSWHPQYLGGFPLLKASSRDRSQLPCPCLPPSLPTATVKAPKQGDSASAFSSLALENARVLFSWRSPRKFAACGACRRAVHQRPTSSKSRVSGLWRLPLRGPCSSKDDHGSTSSTTRAHKCAWCVVAAIRETGTSSPGSLGLLSKQLSHGCGWNAL